MEKAKRARKAETPRQPSLALRCARRTSIPTMSLQDLRRRLYVKAKAETSWRFWGLYVHICKTETLRQAYALVKENDGAPGVDGVTFEAIEAQGVEAFLEQIRDELVQRTYKPLPARRREIPKDGGKVRVLSIPAIRDRVVQGALKLILEPIFEADFQPGSFGYRPKKSAQEAVDRVAKAIDRCKTRVIDLDLRSYFDNVRHDLLLAKVAKRVDDDDVMHLLKIMLKANGRCGVPQGGVISPILANVYLHYAYDLWVQRWRRTKATGDVIVVRFADDQIVGFEHEHEAKAFLQDLHERMRAFELALHPDKTRLIRFGRHAAKQRERRGEGKPETFDFLGFTHFCTRSYKWGSFVIGRKTIKKRMRAKLKVIKMELRKRMHDPIAQSGAWVKQMLQGHLNYYAVSGNHPSMWWFCNQVRGLWLKTLRRRSQKANLSWER